MPLSSSGVAMLHPELREPASALSHGIGMMLALCSSGTSTGSAHTWRTHNVPV